MFHLNEVTLIGNIARKSELILIGDSDKKTINLTVATNIPYGDDGKEDTQFHHCIAWNKTSEVIDKIMEVGDFVMIKGRLNHHKREKDGVKKVFTEIVIDKFNILKHKHPKVSESVSSVHDRLED